MVFEHRATFIRIVCRGVQTYQAKHVFAVRVFPVDMFFERNSKIRDSELSDGPMACPGFVYLHFVDAAGNLSTRAASSVFPFICTKSSWTKLGLTSREGRGRVRLSVELL